VAANAQPYLIECHRGPIAVGHNGNLVNAAILRHELEAAGSIFQSTSDTEVILHLYARSHRERLEDAIAASSRR
jgi:amidophosphoribosyltransferase